MIERMLFWHVEFVDIALPVIVQLAVIRDQHHEYLSSLEPDSVVIFRYQKLLDPNIQVLQGPGGHMHGPGTVLEEPQRGSGTPLEQFGDVLYDVLGDTQRVQLRFKFSQHAEVRLHYFRGTRSQNQLTKPHWDLSNNVSFVENDKLMVTRDSKRVLLERSIVFKEYRISNLLMHVLAQKTFFPKSRH